MPWQRLTTLALALVPNNKGGVNSFQGHRGTAELLRRALFCTGALFVAWLALYLLDIGCIFRLMTGIPCPGCGMTRAWLAALRLDYAAAFAYHPLFWVVPIAFVLARARGGGIEQAKAWYRHCGHRVVRAGRRRMDRAPRQSGRCRSALWRLCARRSSRRYHPPRTPTLAHNPSLLPGVTEDALEKRSTHKRGRTLR